MIPPEIIKRNKVQEYRQALRKGKTRIPRCNLLVLGEKRVGKTSLIRNLTGQPFKDDLFPTRGIENEFVDVVEQRMTSTKCWKMTTRTEQSSKLVVHTAAQVLNDEQEPHNKQQAHISESDLKAELNRVKRNLTEQRKRPSHTQHQHSSQPKRKKYAPPMVEDDSMSNATKVKVRTSVSPPPQRSQVQIEATSSMKRPSSQNKGSDTATSIPAAKKRRPIDTPPVSRQLHLAAIKERKQEPDLHFNILDFAGQQLYRPMHHCFIVRRAIYLVVFNLKKVLEALQNGDRSSIDEIAYWLNSIHIHIHKASPKPRKESKPVFLVGTHKYLLSSSDLMRVHNELKKLFYEKNDRIVNDLHLVEVNVCNIFTPIENSDEERRKSGLHLVDAKPCEIYTPIENSEEDRERSGIIVLQEELRSTSKILPFIKEVYPNVWLQLEDALIRMREKTSVVSLNEVKDIADKDYGIQAKELDAALDFFHDTGTIIFLSELIQSIIFAMPKI